MTSKIKNRALVPTGLVAVSILLIAFTLTHGLDHKTEGAQKTKPKIERFESNGRFSNVVRVNGEYLYLAGIVADAETGDVTVQTGEVLAKIEALLEKYGSDKNHILSANVYLKDVGNMDAFSAVWHEFFHPDHLPARTTVQAPLVRPGIQVEITVTAVRK